MALVVFDSMGQVVEPGTKVLSTRGESATLIRATRAQEIGRSGKVYVQWDKDGYKQEYYDNIVFDLHVKDIPQ